MSRGNGEARGAPDGGEGPSAVRAAVARVGEAAAGLRAAGLARRAAAIGRACERIARGDDDLAGDLALLPPSTGLSSAMVRWALRTTLGPATPEVWLALARDAGLDGGARGRLVQPVGAVAVLLAGNVFTAAARGLLLPLLAGDTVVAKASSSESIFPRLLARTLEEEDREVGRALAVVRFAAGDRAAEDALLDHADAVSVFGSDRTLAEIAARIRPTTRLVPHGHGLGAAYVAAEALDGESAVREVARAIALDVAAYDQRGCLSPHAVFVEPGGAVDARGLAARIAHEGLAPLAGELPRGPLPIEVGAAQLQWRGVGAVRGELFEGDGYATTWEGDGALRVSPGWRNVAVLDCPGVEALVARLAPAGAHLKCLGVAGPAAVREAVAARLPPPLAPRVCAVGAMQTPPLDALADGELPFAGLVRHVAVEGPTRR